MKNQAAKLRFQPVEATRSTFEGSSTWQSHSRKFREWQIYSLASSRLKVLLRSISSSQSRPYFRWFRAGLAPRTNLQPVRCWRKTLWLYQFERSSGKEPESFGSGWAHGLLEGKPR